jgi:hypothetical protein
MRRDEDWFDAVGKDDWRAEQIDLAVKYPQYLGKWIRTDFEGNVVQVSNQPFLFGKQVKFSFPQLPKDHPDWNNPPF